MLCALLGLGLKHFLLVYLSIVLHGGLIGAWLLQLFLRGTARLSINVIGSQEYALRRYNWIFLKRAVRDILILCLQNSS